MIHSYFKTGYIKDGYIKRKILYDSIADQFSNIKNLIPSNWFGDAPTFVEALIWGFASVNSFIYGLILYLKQQTRIRTASDGFLDLIAYDFFGSTLLRKSGQLDDSFRNIIIANLFRERGTRASLSKVVKDITGIEPIIFEPSRPLDTAAYGMPYCGYGAAGRYGSLVLQHQSFVEITKPKSTGIPTVSGYGVPVGAYQTASKIKYSKLDEMTSVVTDEDIYQAIESVKPAGTIVWVKIN